MHPVVRKTTNKISGSWGWMQSMPLSTWHTQNERSLKSFEVLKMADAFYIRYSYFSLDVSSTKRPLLKTGMLVMRAQRGGSVQKFKILILLT